MLVRRSAKPAGGWAPPEPIRLRPKEGGRLRCALVCSQVMYALVNAVASMMSARSVAVFPVGLTALNTMMLHNRAPLVAMCKNAFHPDNQINLRWAALQPLLALTCACVQVGHVFLPSADLPPIEHLGQDIVAL